MTSKLCTPLIAAAAVILTLGAAAAAETLSPATTFVRGFRGEPQGGFRAEWYTHLGMTPMFGVRQKTGMAEMEWKSDAIPVQLSGESVTFVWSGGMGLWSPGGKFTIFVNGRAAADCGMVLESTQFPGRDKGCRLLYDVLHTLQGLDSAGHFFLTVPKAWVKAGEPAALKVKATERGAETWFSLVRGDDAPLAIPDRDWTVLSHGGRQAPGTPPPAGQEASYGWYVSQYDDPVVWTSIGPPGDPAEVAVSPAGQLQQSPDKEEILGTAYRVNAMAFGLYEDGHAVPMGLGGRAWQSLEEDYLPIVVTDWRHGDITIRQRATAEPLRGTRYETGLESTLAWAVFDITNGGKEPREVTFFAAETGDNGHPKRDLAFRDGVVQQGSSARWSAQVPPGFNLTFQAEVPGRDKLDPKANRSDPRSLLQAGGLYNAPSIRA